MKYKFEGSIILEENEVFKPYMGIVRAVSDGYELSTKEIVALYQDRLRKILESYLNIYYPISYLQQDKRLSFFRNIFSLTSLKKSLFIEPGKSFFSPLYLPLQLIFKNFENPTRKKAEELLLKLKENDKRLSAFNFKVSESISECYQFMESLFDQCNTGGTKSKLSVAKTYNPSIFQNKGLNIVTRIQSVLNNHLKEYLIGTYLHGSLSTLDYTPFSDIDAIHIVKKEVLISGAEIRKLSNMNLELSLLLYEYDWLQHHRFQIISEYDLYWYNPSYMPTEVFDNSTALCGSEELKFCVRSPILSAYEHLWSCIQNLRKKTNENFVNINNAWNLKDLVSLVLFIPVLYLGTKQEFCYKKYSFDIAKRDFTDSEWEAVEIATSLRSMWRPFEPSISQTKMKDRSLIKLKNPILFQEMMATSSEPIPTYLLKHLKKTHFFSSIPVFVEAVANRLRGI